LASGCGSAYPCTTARVVSERVVAGRTDSGPGPSRVVERSRLSCRFIKVTNVVRTRFFISSLKAGLITATWDSVSAVPFTWAAISDRRIALEPPMTVSRRILAQVCSTLCRKCRTQSLSDLSSTGTGVWQPGRQDIGCALSSKNPPSELVKLFICNANTKSSRHQSGSLGETLERVVCSDDQGPGAGKFEPEGGSDSVGHSSSGRSAADYVQDRY